MLIGPYLTVHVGQLEIVSEIRERSEQLLVASESQHDGFSARTSTKRIVTSAKQRRG